MRTRTLDITDRPHDVIHEHAQYTSLVAFRRTFSYVSSRLLSSGAWNFRRTFLLFPICFSLLPTLYIPNPVLRTKNKRVGNGTGGEGRAGPPPGYSPSCPYVPSIAPALPRTPPHSAQATPSQTSLQRPRPECLFRVSIFRVPEFSEL